MIGFPRMKYLLFIWCLLASAALAQTPLPPFEFNDGDRVVLLGGTIVEREQKHGYLETSLSQGNADKKITVRNLGWSGDTVFGHARSYFGPPEEGLTRLSAHLEMLKPTVAITCSAAENAPAGDFSGATLSTLSSVARSRACSERVMVCDSEARACPASRDASG